MNWAFLKLVLILLPERSLKKFLQIINPPNVKTADYVCSTSFFGSRQIRVGRLQIRVFILWHLFTLILSFNFSFWCFSSLGSEIKGTLQSLNRTTLFNFMYARLSELFDSCFPAKRYDENYSITSRANQNTWGTNIPQDLYQAVNGFKHPLLSSRQKKIQINVADKTSYLYKVLLTIHCWFLQNRLWRHHQWVQTEPRTAGH